MTIYAAIFYILAVMIMVATALAITRRNLVHAVIYLVISFFGSAMLFYLLGAPFLAALEVIVYAGAIMVLFLFIIMMLKADGLAEHFFPLRQWLPAAGMGLIFLAVGLLTILKDTDGRIMLQTAVAQPREFGQYLFQNHWLAIEIVSLLLLIAIIGVLYLGRPNEKVNGSQS